MAPNHVWRRGLPAAVFLFALLAAARPTAAADPPCSITGVVRDSSGLPLPGATVIVEPSGVEATTDGTGRYCVPPLPPAAYKLTARLDGFRPANARDTVPAEGPITVDFELGPAHAEQVEVQGSLDRPAEGVSTTAVVSRETIQRLAARTLADAIEYTSGVRVETNCQNCNFSQIRLLGLEGPYTQLLVDGQPSVSSLAAVYGIEQMPSRMIERLEIVKGGGSALYGPGAVAGVVNIVPREPSGNGASAELRLETMGGEPSYATSAAADWVSTTRGAFATVFAQADLVRPLDVTGDGFTEVSRRNLKSAGGRFGRQLLGGRAKLTADVLHVQEDRRGGDRLDLPPHEALIAESIDSLRDAGTLTWLHGPGPSFDYRAAVSFARSARDSYYGTGRDPNAYGRTRDRLLVVDARLNHYHGRHIVSWGLQASHERLDDRQPAYNRTTLESYSSGGVFAQDTWAFRRGWDLTLGARADVHSTLARPIVSPRAAVTYAPRTALEVHASVARGFRPPQVFDEDLHLSSVAGDVRIIRLAPDLREERSTSAMLGFEWKPEAGRGQALLEVNAFHARLTDLLHAVEADDPATGELELLKTNFGGASVSGVEVNLGWGIGDRLILQGGFVVQQARFDRPDPDFGSRDFFRAPRVYGNVSATMKDARLGELFVGLRGTGSMRAPHYAGFVAASRLETTPRFGVLDITFSRPVLTTGTRRLVITAALKNATNAFQRDLDQGPLRDAAYVYGPRFPRAFSLGLRVEL